MSQAGIRPLGRRQAYWPSALRLANMLRPAVPALLFGLRLWSSVCLALYIAFWLELDNAYWAGTTAALVCQPALGASLRKGWFRMIGTMVGAIAIVVLSAICPQQRMGFLLGLALWSATSAFASTLLRNFAAYAAALAGTTAAIIAPDELGAFGGTDGQVFTYAITRTSEICIGIVCAGIVLAATDLGGARRRLAALFAATAAEIMGQFTEALLQPGPNVPDTRRELIRRVVALDPIIDQAIGESARLRYHSSIFQSAVDGLFSALAGWRIVATHLARLPAEQARAEAGAVLHNLPNSLRAALFKDEPDRWVTAPIDLRLICGEAIRTLRALPAQTPSLRLLADQTAKVLTGMSYTLLAVGLLVDDPARPVFRQSRVRLQVPDFLPAFINAGRAFVAIGTVAIFWIVTQWPNGATAITWVAIPVILFAPRADDAFSGAAEFAIGAGLAAASAAILDFAVLPALSSFTAFSIALGVILLPIGVLMSWSRWSALLAAVALSLFALLTPENEMNYDTQQFYNTSFALISGVIVAAFSFRLLPPLSPRQRTRRLLVLTLRDLRVLTTGRGFRTPGSWEGLIYSRLSMLPEQAEPLQRAQLLAALSVGTEIMFLRGVIGMFDPRLGMEAAFDAVARGNIVVATERLANIDQHLAALSDTRPGARGRLRARAALLSLSEVLTRHAVFFALQAPR